VVQVHDLRPPRGAKKKRKRIGRGNSAGQGTYSGKGLKGQKARSGNDLRPGFEGGQSPFIKRLGRRRGFTNRFRREYAPVNLSTLDRFDDGEEVTVELLRERGIVKRNLPIKLLATGELSRKLTISVDRVSPAARKKIEAAGGSVTELEPPREKKKKTETVEKRAEAEQPPMDGEAAGDDVAETKPRRKKTEAAADSLTEEEKDGDESSSGT
jgi:large subunit ribosomal protein L15